MGLTTEQVEAILAEYEDKLGQAIGTQNLEAIGSLYSKNAVLIHKNHKVYYGREEIGQGHIPFFSIDYQNFKMEKTAAFEANNGQYLFRQGKFGLAGQKLFDYMQIYEKQADGKYLMIHDAFDWE